jgi:hypothetical protein
MNTILEEGLIAICDTGIGDDGEDELDFAVLKFWFASRAKSKDLFQSSNKKESQTSIKQFWERFHAALSDFTTQDRKRCQIMGRIIALVYNW